MNISNLIPPAASPRPMSRGQSRAIGSGPSRSQNNPNQNVLKDRFSNITTIKDQIEKQREYDAGLEHLRKEFSILDRNQDGVVTLEELKQFLDEKSGGPGRFDHKLTEEIYSMIDLN